MAAVLSSVRALFAPSDFTIDVETPADVVAREVLLDRVMGTDRHKKASERVRRGRIPGDGLAVVARTADRQLIGTVRLWNIEAGVTPRGLPVEALLLGPLAVDHDHVGKGVGAALLRTSMRAAAIRSHGAIILVGDGSYYQRFGFSADRTKHLLMPGPCERARLLGFELKAGWLDGAAGMIVASGRKLASP